MRFDGVFDAAAALRAVAAIETGRTLVVDLTAVREFQDVAVARLAEAIAARPGARVSLKGLRQHQTRLLRYFGVPA